MKRQCSLLLLIILVGLALIRCSSTSGLAGNTSSETTNGFTAAIVYPNGAPAAQVVVRLRRADYLADTNSALAKIAVAQIDTLTDETGRLNIQSVDTGSYLIEAADANGNALAVPCIIIGDSLIDLGVQVLSPSGTIAGSIGGPSVQGFVRIRGLERCVRADTSGVFEMKVPAGLSYSFTITASDTAADFSLTQPVQSAQTVSVTADLGTHRTDSLAIRALLDSMGLTTIPVDSVALADAISNRFRTLDLSHRGLTAIPPSIEKLSFIWALEVGNNPLVDLPSTLEKIPLLAALSLDSTSIAVLPSVVTNCVNLQWLYLRASGIRDLPREITRLSVLHTLDFSEDSLLTVPSVVFSLASLKSLNLSQNQLTQLPASLGNLTVLEGLHLDNNQLDSLPQEIGSLRHLKFMYAYSNNLTVLPDSISRCDSLRYLHLWNNRLTSLPDSIINLKPLDGLYLGANQLCSLSTSIQTWANIYAETNWAGNQTCP